MQNNKCRFPNKVQVIVNRERVRWKAPLPKIASVPADCLKEQSKLQDYLSDYLLTHWQGGMRRTRVSAYVCTWVRVPSCMPSRQPVHLHSCWWAAERSKARENGAVKFNSQATALYPRNINNSADNCSSRISDLTMWMYPPLVFWCPVKLTS